MAAAVDRRGHSGLTPPNGSAGSILAAHAQAVVLSPERVADWT